MKNDAALSILSVPILAATVTLAFYLISILWVSSQEPSFGLSAGVLFFLVIIGSLVGLGVNAYVLRRAISNRTAKYSRVAMAASGISLAILAYVLAYYIIVFVGPSL